jgi:hypothetical protein
MNSLHLDFAPGRLWSLWDMLKFNARSFYSAVSTMRRAHALMDKESDKKKTEISAKERRSAPKVLARLETACAELGTPVTKMAVSELIEAIKSRKRRLTHEEFSSILKEVDGTLRRELSLVNLFVLDGKAQEYFAPKGPLFGTGFESSFPSAAYELDEAGKCLALGRPTASVFHLMRIMETGIKAVARCLGMPDPTRPAERNWGLILKNIKGEIDARNAQQQWVNQLDREFFESSYASLDAVRVAWRNTTMHVENKYSPDEAEHVFAAVRGFMKQLVSRCDEQGQPTA